MHQVERFAFSQLGPGRHQLDVTSSGYRPHVVVAEASDGETEVQIRLSPVPGGTLED